MALVNLELNPAIHTHSVFLIRKRALLLIRKKMSGAQYCRLKYLLHALRTNWHVVIAHVILD